MKVDPHFNQKSKISWIESLRGLACLCVVIQHYLPVGTFIFNFGNFGVVLFFLISGFIVTKSLMPPRRLSSLDFILLRIGRLYPAYWVALILFFMIGTPSIHEMLANLTMFQRFLGFPDLNPVCWTLQIEWVFYLLLAFFILMGGIHKKNIFRSWVFFVFLSLACSIIRFYFDKKAPSALPIGLSSIFLSAFWVLSSSKLEKYLMLFFHIVLIVFVCSFLSYSQFWGYEDYPHSFIVSDLLALGLFALFKKYEIQLSLLNFLGKISFSLYLLHEPLRIFISLFISNSVENIFIAFLASILISYLVFKGVEEPLNHFTRKVVGFRRGNQLSK